MFVPLGIRTDYSLLQSLIKMPILFAYLKQHNLSTCAILDDNLFGSMAFYKGCLANDIKPIIGLKVYLQENYFYLYAKNYEGYLNLLKVDTLIQNKEVSYVTLKTLKSSLLCVLPFESLSIYDELLTIYHDLYLGYKNHFEKSNAIIKNSNIVYIQEMCCFSFQEVKYLGMLREIDLGVSQDLQIYSDAYLDKEILDEDAKTTEEFAQMFDLKIPKQGTYIPHYDKDIEDSFAYLTSLCKKGLLKRLNGEIPSAYEERLDYELEVIHSMGFVDYFLIVYDYVRYAKMHHILVGPGRGSAAGSLVSYVLGITSVDPIAYDLLFERFLNPERITMPDIDIDFEYTKRDQVISYVKEKYGKTCVANIMTFGTFGARQVIRDVGKCLNVDVKLVDRLSSLLDPKSSLEENLKNKTIHDFVMQHASLNEVYQISYKLEGLKRHISTHAAGVVISSVPLDEVIPVCNNGGELLTGYTMEFLEDLGLLKMDFLALRNLTIIQNVLELIKEETGKELPLASIPLEDPVTMNIFRQVDTEGVFQFESSGMKSFIAKLKPTSFSDLVAALALYRPGPMQNIDMFIRRKEGKEKVIYPDSSLEPILKDTYGIMVYQEQIMQVLVLMGGYRFSEADNIRRAMSKKKVEVMEKEREVFIKRSIHNGYTKDVAEEVYDTILAFANYGFNKAHSVSYALIGYQMAYLKANYPVYFMANLLNMSIGSVIKTKEYIDEAKKKNIRFFKPNINVSLDSYVIKGNALLLPLSAIHNIGGAAVAQILLARKEGGRFTDFFNFVARTYGKSVNKKTIEALIDADCFRDFGVNHNTLVQNIDSALDYALLCNDLDESFVMKPNIVEHEEYSEPLLMTKELETFGYYVTNHPASKFQHNVMKLNRIVQFFDKFVSCVVIINSVRKIKTKKGETMGFISASDETDTIDFIVFPKHNAFLNLVKSGDFVRFRGQVVKRLDKYQIVITNMEEL